MDVDNSNSFAMGPTIVTASSTEDNDNSNEPGNHTRMMGIMANDDKLDGMDLHTNNNNGIGDGQQPLQEEEGQDVDQQQQTNNAGDTVTDNNSTPSEVDAITHRAARQLEKILDETKNCANELLHEITIFATEFDIINKEWNLIQQHGHEESARLDRVEPEVRSFASILPVPVIPTSNTGDDAVGPSSEFQQQEQQPIMMNHHVVVGHRNQQQ